MKCTFPETADKASARVSKTRIDCRIFRGKCDDDFVMSCLSLHMITRLVNVVASLITAAIFLT